MSWLLSPLHKAMAAAATLTGKKFGLLVASSVVATSVIVASAMTATNGSGPLAALLGRSLAADQAPAPSKPPAEEEAHEPPSSPGSEASSPAPASPSVTPAPASEPEPGPEPEPEPEEPAPEEPAPETGPARHVFVISLASPGYDAAFGEASVMPYLAETLRPQGDLLTNFKLLGEAAPANALAAVSGQPPSKAAKAGCPSYEACLYPAEDLTLADQLGIAQLSWRAYMEAMVDPLTAKPANCVYPQPGDPSEVPAGAYGARLNPFVYFHSLLDLGDCAADDVPLTGLEKDLNKVSTTPSFAYLSPTPCNAGFAGKCAEGSTEGPAAADAFLANWVPKILASPAFKKDGLLIVTFAGLSPVPAPAATGEGAATATGATAAASATAATATPLKTGTLLVSNFLSPGAADAVEYTPYSLLRSSEELFGLSLLANAGGKKVKSFVPALRGTNGGD